MTTAATATPGTSPNPSPPIHLPREIYLNVIPLLAKPELAQCCQVSQFFNSVVTPKLYKALHVEFGENPSFTIPLRVGATSEEGSAGACGKAMGDGPGSDVGKELNMPNLETSDVKPIPRFIPHHDRYSFTTYLTISLHDRELCESLEPLALPNLITLRILGAGLEICYPHKTCPPQSTPCLFIASLRPRRIVLGGRTSSTLSRMTGSGINVPNFPPTSVTELVFIIGEGDDRHDDTVYHSIVDSVSDTINSITLVIETMGTGEAIEASTTRRSTEEAALLQRKISHGRSLLYAMVGACEGKARNVKVVGSEGVSFDIIPDLVLTPTVQDTKGTLVECLVAMGWSDKAAADKAEEVNFVEMKDYDGEVR